MVQNRFWVALATPCLLLACAPRYRLYQPEELKGQSPASLKWAANADCGAIDSVDGTKPDGAKWGAGNGFLIRLAPGQHELVASKCRVTNLQQSGNVVQGTLREEGTSRVTFNAKAGQGYHLFFCPEGARIKERTLTLNGPSCGN
jgi:hypothetical protein